MPQRLAPHLALVLLLLAGAGAPFQARAQAETMAEALQSPAAFLGYALGARFTPPHRAARYARHVARTSPRATLTRYGTTPEGRPLQLLTLSASGNLARIDEIRRAHLSATGLGPDASAAEEDRAVVWLSYNIHGDEAVGTEAALRTLHALADPENARTGRMLRDAVVLLDPCVNPDGRARYVQWYRQTRGTQPDARPEAREHAPPWPGGRTNHFLFDLNRDWAWATQPETRARLAQYHRWMPHIHADFHEQGVDDPYYFAPGAEPMHEALTPFQQRFQEEMGRANAEVFDREGWLYFTGERFDLLYPGYGDTWPLFNGAVGMTYEQAGSGRAGLVIQTETDSLSLAERVAHHHATALQTVETAVAHRSRLTRAFADYYRSARDGLDDAAAAYVVSGRNEDRREALAQLLEHQRIRYAYAGESSAARGVRYATGETERFRIEACDLVVPTAQPKARLAKVLFERQPTLTDSLTYDITAWALPFAFNVEAHAVPDVPSGSARGANRCLDDAAPPTEASAPYAYLAEWQSLADARLLGRLLARDVRVRFAHQPFEAAGRRWERGTLLVARADNQSLGARFAEEVVAAAGDQPLTPLGGGLTSGGPDFGSAGFALLEAPTVAVLAGPDLSAYAVGEAWHFFDQRLRHPATLIDADRLAGALHGGTLDEFDVIVMPPGDYDAVLPRAEDRARLHRWAERGGRLVAMGRAARFLAGVDGFALAERDARSAPSDSAGQAGGPYAGRERAAASRRVPGAIFRAVLDATHPLAYGYAAPGSPSQNGAARYYTLKRGGRALAPFDASTEAGRGGWNVAVLPDDEGRAVPISGFAGAQAQRQLGGALVFGVEEIGEGRAVYLADDPLFRGFWQGGMLLFANAVFLVGQDGG